jgi:hypothetical protein
VFFDINICRTYLEDVKWLTEIAHDHGIINYHIRITRLMSGSWTR